MVHHHRPVRDNLRFFILGTETPLPTDKPLRRRSHSSTVSRRIMEEEKGGEQNVLRCSGTPRISGKLFTGLSVDRTAALCIIVIQTGRQTHAHTPGTLWARSPVLSCGEKKKSMTVLMSRPLLGAPSPSRQASIPGVDVCAAPCRAVLE